MPGGARGSRAPAKPLLGVRRGHPYVDDRDLGPVRVDHAWSSPPSSASPTTSTPARRQQRGDPLAHSAGCRRRSRPSRQLRPHHRAGSRGGWTTLSRPSSASTRSASPRSPEPRAARRRPRRRRRSRSRAPVACARRARWRVACGVLGDVGERLRGDEVRRELDGSGSAASASQATDGRHRRAGRERLERGREAVVEHRRMDPARELAQLGERLASSSLAAVTSSSARRVVADAAASRRSCSASATSRCWAPSCRLRSSRRRSASPAATIRSREAWSSASRISDSACRCSFSSAIAAAARTASTSSGSSSSEAS